MIMHHKRCSKKKFRGKLELSEGASNRCQRREYWSAERRLRGHTFSPSQSTQITFFRSNFTLGSYLLPSLYSASILVFTLRCTLTFSPLDRIGTSRPEPKFNLNDRFHLSSSTQIRCFIGMSSSIHQNRFSWSWSYIGARASWSSASSSVCRGFSSEVWLVSSLRMHVVVRLVFFGISAMKTFGLREESMAIAAGRGWSIWCREAGSSPISFMRSERKVMPVLVLKHSRIIHRREILARQGIVSFSTEKING